MDEIIDSTLSEDMYDAYYYGHCCGPEHKRSEELLSHFRGIANKIVVGIRPSTVLDVGCAIGLLVEALRNLGVGALGINVSHYALDQMPEDLRQFCKEASIPTPLQSRYDLAVCSEVLEHLPPDAAEIAVANLCGCAHDVLFSASPDDYGEATHLNVRPPEYWASLFAKNGFFRDLDFDASFLAPWAIRFRMKSTPIHKLVAVYERRLWSMTRENRDLRQRSLEVRRKVAQAEAAIDSSRAQIANLQKHSPIWEEYWVSICRSTRLVVRGMQVLLLEGPLPLLRRVSTRLGKGTQCRRPAK